MPSSWRSLDIPTSATAETDRKTGLEQRNRPPRDGAEAMHADLAIERDCPAANQRRELACRASSRQIHLEEAVLSVQKAGRARQVDTIGRAYGGHAEAVPRDLHGRRQARNPALTVELGKAGPQLSTRPEPTAGRGNGHEDRCYQQRAPQPSQRRAAGTRGRGIKGRTRRHVSIVTRRPANVEACRLFCVEVVGF